jgi:phage gpG-like protein
VTIEVRGADRLAVTLAAAARDLERQPAVQQRMAERVRNSARPPRRTGRLAASLTASATDTEATVSSSLVYAPVIERGWAGHNITATWFLSDALRAEQAAVVDLEADHIDTTLGQVKGV